MPRAAHGPVRLGLRAALAVRVLLPVGGILLVAVIGGLYALERESERRMKDDVDLVARALRLPLVHAMSRDPQGVDEALRSAFLIGRVYGAYVYGADGTVLAAYGPAIPTGPPDELDELVAGGDRVGAFGRIGGRRVYSSFVPLNDLWGRSLGILQVTRRRRDFEEDAARLRVWALGWLVLGVTVVAVLVLRGHHRAAVAPLARLSTSMARIGSGETDHRAATDGPKEVANAAATLNRMLDDLASAARELRESTEVQDALTRELAAAENLAAVGELASGVAHELGAPLSVIDGHAQRWLRSGRLAPGTGRDVATVRTQVGRMQEIVRQLLEFGRTESGRRREVDLAILVHGAASSAGDEARDRCTRLDLAPPPRPVIVEAEARRLEEALGHLIRNAVDAADGGLVRVSWCHRDHTAELTVEDDGPGVPDELRTRVFEPFFTTKRTGQGSGLGLAVVRGVVERHGATIDVGPSALGGARFTLRLPAVDREKRCT